MKNKRNSEQQNKKKRKAKEKYSKNKQSYLYSNSSHENFLAGWNGIHKYNLICDEIGFDFFFRGRRKHLIFPPLFKKIK